MDNGSDKLFQCNPCKRHEQKSESKYWCEQCSEAFCEKCNSMHSWMKLLMTHDVVPIEDVGSKTDGLDLMGVSEYCRLHPLKMVEVFCFQHKTACCGLCAGIDHRKCDNVKQIEEIVHSSEMYTGNSLLGSLNDIKESTKTVLQAKEQEKANINVIAENTEEDATNFIQVIRSKLDICFEVFKKQLTVFRDEQNTRLNIRIRLLEQLIQSIEHWIKVIEVVQTSGSIIKLFVHVETVKQQIETSIKELEHLCSSDTDIHVCFEQNETLQKLESVDQIGSFRLHEKEIEINQLSDVFKKCSKIGICVPKFEDISIQHSRTMHFPGSKLTCGVCIADKFILLGDATTNQKMLHLVDRKTGLTISKTGITGDVKRLYFDKDLNRIFISCYNKGLFNADFKGESIAKINKMSFNADFVGALCRFDKHIYIIVNNAIKKFIPSDSPKEMTKCFLTNTNSTELNGMTIWKEKVFYTTTDKEVKCASLDGRQIFTHKSDKMRQPVSIAMLSADVLIILDRNCTLHALSSDGKKHSILLQKFQKVADPCDMWISIDDNTVYVAGGEHIDVYKIELNVKF
ncbi:uncharacterized protein LOC134690053 [Mytilus trossulus]|uniref:uncharacterized protein LOC134690053 n=1 Tax=Mytilus trossulus TaxID=6551 RepID=UPI003003F012